jgi:hypothetical protein
MAVVFCDLPLSFLGMGRKKVKESRWMGRIGMEAWSRR